VNAPAKHIVLLGIGHTNAHVVKKWASDPIPASYRHFAVDMDHRIDIHGHRIDSHGHRSGHHHSQKNGGLEIKCQNFPND
jgi:hypothetical protein